MGTMRLECPLCCTETFPTPTDLKYHLLNMIDNLLCTGCAKKFETIRELAEHIAGECRVNEKATEASGDAVEAEKETEGNTDGIIFIKSELQDETEEAEAPKEESETVNEAEEAVNTEDETANEGAEIFLCSACNISFEDLEDHVKKYHFGQNVYFEEEVSDATATTTTVETVAVVDNEGETEADPTLDSIQEEFVDKSGRPYTRKVVQIEKFWDEGSRPADGVQYYRVSDDAADDVKKDEETELLEPGSIVNVFHCNRCSMNCTKDHKCSQVKFDCSECDASFPQRRSLSAHMRMHTNAKGKDVKVVPGSVQPQTEGPFMCDICTTPFTTFKSLRLHQRMHDPLKKVKEVEAPVNYGIMGEDLDDGNTERVMFTCKICNKEYDEVYRFAHMKFHSQEENFDCDICNRKFYTQSNLEMHMRVHSAGKPQSCNYCKQEFTDYKTLQQHVKTHIESRPYQCQYCSRRFFRPHEKVKHERIHTGEKPHICQICGKSFRVSYCLTLHMRTHSGSRPYQCQECGKRFKAHSVYNHHLLIHSSERKYKCPYCPKAFKTAVQLAGHKNTHTKPFSCTECNRPFASLYAVRSHMETHKQENNLKYHCNMCGASYARAFALRDHIKAHHEDQQWEEDLEQLQENSDAATSIISTGDDASMAVQNVLILGDELGVETVEMPDGSQVEEVTFMET